MSEAADRTVARSRRHDGRVVGLICGGHFFSHFYMLLLPPLFPLLKGEFDVSFTALGATLAAFSIASGAAQYPLGVLVDRIGARVLLVAGLVVLSLAVGLMGLAPDVPTLIALAFVAGLGNSVFHPADYSILGASVREHRLGVAYSVHTFCGHAGWAAAPIMIVGLTALIGWRWSLAVLALGGLLMALLIQLNKAHIADDTVKPAARPAMTRRQGMAADFKVVLAPAVLLMLMFNFIATATIVGMPSFTPSALTSLYDTPLGWANAVLTVFLVGSAVGVLFGGFVADKVRRLDLVAAGGFLIAGAAVSVVAMADVPIIAIIAIFGFAGFVLGMIAPSRDLMIRSITPPGASGKVFGFVSIGLDLGGAVAPLVFGYILDQGEPRGIFYLGVALMLLSLLIAVAASAAGRRQAPAPAAE